MNDPFGQAIKDFFEYGEASDLIINSNYTEDEIIPVAYLFRKEKEMPAIEQTALKLCKGKVLDIGAVAGCHSIVLQEKGFEVTALEQSELAAEVIKKRGIRDVVCDDIFNFSNNKYDTILLLMNGAGIGETIEGLKKLLVHLKTLLNETIPAGITNLEWNGTDKMNKPVASGMYFYKMKTKKQNKISKMLLLK